MPTEEIHICCPPCEWEPGPDDAWQCYCGHVWNTFQTYGQCPACGYVHRHTQCLACNRFSPHADWYRNLPGLDQEEIVEILTIEAPLHP